MASLIEGPTIGIDLGTTYCCMSVYQNGKCDIIPIDNENTMASFVSFAENGRLIGNKAKENSVLNPANTVSDVKRYIGCRFKSPELQPNINKYLYEIIDDNDSPKIKIVFNKEDMVFTPEEISAMLLTKMKQCAEEYFEKLICKAVITVPANFKDSQRQATIDAARIAGLDPRRIINEPTAAALAFRVREIYHNDTEEKNILVYDFGGGTFDVSIINLDSDILDVKATFGDNYLGGNDIDECLVQHFKEQFEVKNQLSLENQPRALRRLRIQCEKIKIKLSTEENATIDLDQLMNNKDLYDAISRSEFENLCRPVIERTIPLVEKVLEEAGLDKTKIDDVLLVGGSTRIPLVRKILRDFFGKELNTSLDPDLAVAMGASIQASILDGDDNQTIGTLLLLDVIPLSLGIATSGGIMAKIIRRNTPIPAKLTKKFTNEKDNQKKINILVYEGERTMAEDNNKLGEFVMSGITPQPRGECVVNITFEVDTDGILSLTAEEDTISEQKNILAVTVDKGRLSDDEIQKMIETAKKLEKEDKIKQQIVLSRIALESLCIDSKHKANKYINEKGDCYKIIEKCDETLIWLQENQMESQDAYETKKKEVSNFIRPIMIKYM